MRSNDEGMPDVGMRDGAATERRLESIAETFGAAMFRKAALGIFILACLAGMAYIAVGGRLEPLSVSNADAAVARTAQIPSAVGAGRSSTEASAEGLVGRCDEFSVAAANRIDDRGIHGVRWRRERQSAFRRCADEFLSGRRK